MAGVKVSRSRSRTTKTVKTRVKKGSKGNPNKCPVCGKFMGKK